MRRICCVCLKIKSQNGWERGGSLKDGKISHGYCPKCYRELIAQIPADVFADRYKKAVN